MSQETWELNDDYRLSFMRDFLVNMIILIVLSQLKIPKTTSLGISKMWSIIFQELSGNLSKFQLIKNQQNCSNVLYLRQFLKIQRR